MTMPGHSENVQRINQAKVDANQYICPKMEAVFSLKTTVNYRSQADARALANYLHVFMNADANVS